MSGEKSSLTIANALPLSNIPVGMSIHNIEMYPGAGGKFIRSGGTSAQITSKEGKYVTVRMPSGEVRKFLANCYATIGQLGADEWKLVTIGKAGRKHHMGVRPTTRGKARAWDTRSQVLIREELGDSRLICGGTNQRERKLEAESILISI